MLDGAARPLHKAQEKKVAESQDAGAEQQFCANAKVSHALPSDCVHLDPSGSAGWLRSHDLSDRVNLPIAPIG